MLRKRKGFIGTQKSQDVKIKSKLQRTKINKTKVGVGRFLREKNFKKMKSLVMWIAIWEMDS